MPPVEPIFRNGEDLRVSACNYAEAISSAAERAKCYVLNPNRGNGGDRLYVLARSRSGRWIHKWENAKRLKNFRRVTIPPEHPLFRALSDYIREP